MTIVKKVLKLGAAAVILASPALAGHDSPFWGESGGYGEGSGYAGSGGRWPNNGSFDLLQQAEFVFAELERATARLSGGSQSGVGTYNLDWVGPYGDEYVDDTFRAGTAVIALMGEGPDIDLHVYDENGRTLCSSTSYSAEEVCEVELAYPQSLQIRVDNQDQMRGSRFRLWTN